MLCNFLADQCHEFELRAYMYQARELYSGDRSGLSDPYAVVSFSNFSQKTEVIKDTRNPQWKQTLIFTEIEVHGNKNFLKEHVAPVTIVLWDKDVIVS